MLNCILIRFVLRWRCNWDFGSFFGGDILEVQLWLLCSRYMDSLSLLFGWIVQTCSNTREAYFTEGRLLALEEVAATNIRNLCHFPPYIVVYPLTALYPTRCYGHLYFVPIFIVPLDLRAYGIGLAGKYKNWQVARGLDRVPWKLLLSHFLPSSFPLFLVLS